MENGFVYRLRKYCFHYFLVIPATLLLIVFKVIPLIGEVIVSLRNLELFKGILRSSWVWFNNYRDLFSSMPFRKTLINTVTLKLGHVIITSILAMVIALVFSMITNRSVRKAFSTVFLLPHFIPVTVFSYFVMLFLSPTSSPIPGIKVLLLADSRYFRLVILAIEAVRNVGLPVLVAVAAYERAREGRKYAALLKAIAAFAAMQLTALLTFDFELMRMMSNPLVYDVADTLENYTFRGGIVQSVYGISSAAWVFRFLVQAVLAIPFYFLLKSLFKRDLFGDNDVNGNSDVIGNNDDKTGNADNTGNAGKTPARNPAKESWGTVMALLMTLVPLFVILVILIYPFIPGEGIGFSALLGKVPGFFDSYFKHLVAALFSAIINTFLTVTLAFPLTAKRLPGRTLYKIILLLLIVASTGYPPLAEYLFFRKLGMVNTLAPYIIGGMFSLINVFILKSIFNSRYSDAKEKAEQENQSELSQFFTLFIPRTWKAITAMFLIQFIAVWNSYIYPLLYTTNVQSGSPMLFISNMLTSAVSNGISMNDPALMKLALIVALPAVIAFLAGYRIINAEILSGRMRE